MEKNLKVDDRVFLQVPLLKKGSAYKFARQFRGPYRVLQLYDNGADIRLVDKPNDPSFRVSLNRLRLCPKEIQSGMEQQKGGEKGEGQEETTASEVVIDESPNTWTCRLRPRRERTSMKMLARSGDM